MFLKVYEPGTVYSIFSDQPERLADKNDWQHYVYQAGECALHGTYVGTTGIELCRNDFDHNTASSCMHVATENLPYF